MNRTQQAIVHAYNAGYSCTDAGAIVSPSGVTRRLSRPRPRSNKRKATYYRFTVSMPGRSRSARTVSIPVHQFVAFCKYSYFSLHPAFVVRHLNGVATDNSWQNIGLGTMADNMRDRDPQLRKEISRNANRRYDDRTLAAIIADRKAGMSYVELMDKYRIRSKGTVSYIVRRSLSARLAYSDAS